MKIAYRVELTVGEYKSADYMAHRGYLGELTRHATEIEESKDGTVVLGFTESDAWKVKETCEADPDAVWSLTTPFTSLGEKFQRFLNSIV